MSESTLQPVEGAGILSKIIDMFFKSLNKVFSEDPEYVEENGIVKQTNRITITDGEKDYTFTLKLSPVKDKTDYYFIEASTDAPNLDLSSINKKAFKITRENAAEFKAILEKMITDSKYSIKKVEQEQAEEEEVEKDEVDKFIKAAEKWFNQKAIMAKTSDGEAVQIIPSVERGDVLYSIEVIFDVVDKANKPVRCKELKDSIIDIKDEDGNMMDQDEFLSILNDMIVDFADLNNYTNMQRVIKNSTIIRATFIKDNNKVSLTAIKASNDLEHTMDVIYDIIDSQDFANSLQEGQESSYTIEELDDEYKIEPTSEAVGCMQCYSDIYTTVSKLYVTLKVLESMIGIKVWSNDNFFSDLTELATRIQTETSIWVAKHSDILPILMNPFLLVPTFEQFRDYSDNSQIPQIKEELIELIDRTTELCSFLSVGLEAEEQSRLSNLFDEFERLLNN